ncbi:hypothetical protein Fot_03642 [Forsythia ovata]|uniref:Uncharacterized protein n=1 Tax=Forsythia ovata TaxID=205694 RepID=A0ABD1XDE6_9LAMI
MAEMNTVLSHILNCELYKVFAMKVDKLCLTVVGVEDIDALRSKNKALRARLPIVEDARAQAVFIVTKSKTIQMVYAQAQKKVELQLKVCEDMLKELAENQTLSLPNFLYLFNYASNVYLASFIDCGVNGDFHPEFCSVISGIRLAHMHKIAVSTVLSSEVCTLFQVLLIVA